MSTVFCSSFPVVHFEWSGPLFAVNLHLLDSRRTVTLKAVSWAYCCESTIRPAVLSSLVFFRRRATRRWHTSTAFYIVRDPQLLYTPSSWTPMSPQLSSHLSPTVSFYSYCILPVFVSVPYPSVSALFVLQMRIAWRHGTSSLEMKSPKLRHACHVVFVPVRTLLSFGNAIFGISGKVV